MAFIEQRSRSLPAALPPSSRRFHGRSGSPELIFLTVIWGINFPLAKALLSHLSPLALNALRFPLASLVLLVALGRRPSSLRPPRSELPRLLLLAAGGNVLYQLCFVYGLRATLAGNASLLLATSPLWTILLAAVVGEERANATVLGAAGVTLAGIVLVVIGGGSRVGVGGGAWGDALMILAAVLWAMYTVGARPAIQRYGSLAVTAWTLWLGTPALVVAGIPDLLRTPWGDLPPWVWVGVAYSGALSVGVAYLLWYRGVQRLGSSRTAIYANLVPITAMITAWPALGEVPAPLQLVGAAVILFGLWVARRGRTLSPPSPARGGDELPGIRSTEPPASRSPT